MGGDDVGMGLGGQAGAEMIDDDEFDAGGDERTPDGATIVTAIRARHRVLSQQPLKTQRSIWP